MTQFAVIKTGGKQYIVREGDELSIEKLAPEATLNGAVTFEEVLLVAKEKTADIGQPFLKGAKVTARVIAEGKGVKKMVFRYKSKTRQKKKKGHRQPFTKVIIEAISAK